MAEPFFIRCTYLVTWIIFHLKKRCSYYKTDADWGALKDFEQEDSLLVKAGRMGGGGPGRRRGSESLEVRAGVGHRTGWLGDRPGVAATWGAGSEILLAPPFTRHPFSPNCSAFRSQQNPNLCGLALLPLTPLPFPVPVPGPLHSSTAATPRFPGPAPDPRSLASAGRLPRSRSLAMLDTLLLVPPPPQNTSFWRAGTSSHHCCLPVVVNV